MSGFSCFMGSNIPGAETVSADKKGNLMSRRLLDALLAKALAPVDACEMEAAE
ncbi:MAG: hypothetical protein K9G59_19180 [Caulobacter sp.]|nr:hypothetical protein [Caulobacter sp.]